MFTVPCHRDTILTTSLSDASVLSKSRAMAELMHQMRDPAHTLGGSVGSIPQTLVSNSSTGGDMSLQKALSGNGVHITPATNLKLSEALRQAQHDASPNLVSSSKMKSSKSYTHGLSNSAGTVNIPTSTSAQSNLSLLADISPNHTHFFEVMYVGKIRVSHKRVPFSFIDDALPKFKAYDAQRQRLMQISSNRKVPINSEGTFLGTGSLDLKTCSLKDNDVKEVDEDEAECEKENEKENNSDECVVKTILEDKIKDDETSTGASSSNEEETKPVQKNKQHKLLPPGRLVRGLSQLEINVKKEDNLNSNDLQIIDETENLPLNVVLNKHPSPPRQEEENPIPSEPQLPQQDQQQQQQLNANDGLDK